MHPLPINTEFKRKNSINYKVRLPHPKKKTAKNSHKVDKKIRFHIMIKQITQIQN